MMHLIHRNRIAFLGRLRCGPPSPAWKAYFSCPPFHRLNKTDTKMTYPPTDNHSERMRDKALPRWGRGTAAEII